MSGPTKYQIWCGVALDAGLGLKGRSAWFLRILATEEEFSFAEGVPVRLGEAQVFDEAKRELEARGHAEPDVWFAGYDTKRSTWAWWA